MKMPQPGKANTEMEKKMAERECVQSQLCFQRRCGGL